MVIHSAGAQAHSTTGGESASPAHGKGQAGSLHHLHTGVAADPGVPRARSPDSSPSVPSTLALCTARASMLTRRLQEHPVLSDRDVRAVAFSKPRRLSSSFFENTIAPRLSVPRRSERTRPHESCACAVSAAGFGGAKRWRPSKRPSTRPPHMGVSLGRKQEQGAPRAAPGRT